MALLLTGTLGGTSIGEQLLAAIRNIFTRQGVDRLPSVGLCRELSAVEDAPWEDHQGHSYIIPRQLAKLLQPFGIAPDSIRIVDKTPKGYRLNQFEGAFSRYLAPLPSEIATPQQSRVSTGLEGTESATRTPPVADGDVTGPAEVLNCCGVADAEEEVAVV